MKVIKHFNIAINFFMFYRFVNLETFHIVTVHKLIITIREIQPKKRLSEIFLGRVYHLSESVHTNACMINIAGAETISMV